MSAPGNATPPLRVIAEQLRTELQLSGNLKEIVDAACEQLGIVTNVDAALMEKAQRCHFEVFGARGRRPSARPTSAGGARTAGFAADIVLGHPLQVVQGRAVPENSHHEMVRLPHSESGDDSFIDVPRFLRIKGIERAFQYHNFYGDWELSAAEPVRHGRPHYVHNTMYRGLVHLFHWIDPNYNVPRWVMGPEVGNDQGWAFAESDARLPHQVSSRWISWDGFEWHECMLRFALLPMDADGGSRAEDSDDELELQARFVGEDGEQLAQSTLASVNGEPARALLRGASPDDELRQPMAVMGTQPTLVLAVGEPRPPNSVVPSIESPAGGIELPGGEAPRPALLSAQAASKSRACVIL